MRRVAGNEGDTRKDPAAPAPFERTLIERAQTGDAGALEQLAREAWAPSFVLARAILADETTAQDIAQEAVLAALGALGGFDVKRPFAPWLHRITMNCCRDAQRRTGARPPLTNAGPHEYEDSQAADTGGLPDHLREALLALSVEQRAAVVLRHLFDLSAAEIAASLQTTEVNARTLIHRGLAQLRQRLQSTHPAEEASK